VIDGVFLGSQAKARSRIASLIAGTQLECKFHQDKDRSQEGDSLPPQPQRAGSRSFDSLRSLRMTAASVGRPQFHPPWAGEAIGR
jgi:hypothetical protein